MLTTYQFRLDLRLIYNHFRFRFQQQKGPSSRVVAFSDNKQQLSSSPSSLSNNNINGVNSDESDLIGDESSLRNISRSFGEIVTSSPRHGKQPNVHAMAAGRPRMSVSSAAHQHAMSPGQVSVWVCVVQITFNELNAHLRTDK